MFISFISEILGWAQTLFKGRGSILVFRGGGVPLIIHKGVNSPKCLFSPLNLAKHLDIREDLGNTPSWIRHCHKNVDGCLHFYRP
jgi:hypothetical protein